MSDRRHPRLALTGELSALVELPGGEERLEPVLDLSAEGLALLLRTQQPALRPGHLLPRLRLFNHGTCALDIQAEVREVTEVSLEAGGVGQRVGLQLGEATATLTGSEELDSDPANLTSSVDALTRARARVQITAAGQSPQEGRGGRALNADPHQRVWAVELIGDGDTQLIPDQLYDIHAQLLGHRIALRAMLKRVDQDVLRLEWPTERRRWRGRRGHRLRSEDDARVTFETPFQTGFRERRVIDVSSGGVAFESAPEDGLMVGMLLPRFELALPATKGGTKRVAGRAMVRHMRHTSEHELMVGVQMLDLSAAQQKELRRYIERRVHPAVRRATAADLGPLWSLYRDCGLLSADEASRHWQRLEVERRALLQRGQEIMLTLVGTTDDLVEGTVELVRTYPRTWTTQHLAIRGESRLTPDQLLIPLFEAAASLPNCTFLRSLWVASSPEHLDRLRELTAHSGHLAWRPWAVFTVDSNLTMPAPTHGVQAATGADLAWAEDQLAHWAAPLEQSALALGGRDLDLNALTSAYRTLGLERGRQVRVAMSISEPTGLSLLEWTSVGVCLAREAEVARLLPTARRPETRSQALLSLAWDAVAVQRQRQRPARLWVSPGDGDILLQAGFTPLGLRAEMIVRQDSAHQLLNGRRVLDPNLHWSTSE